MAYFYFDESIRENGQFIIGALVICETDLSSVIRQKWSDMGLDPDLNEYKSSVSKKDNPLSIEQRGVISALLLNCKLGIVVLPVEYRYELGNYCAKLLHQLFDSSLIPSEKHQVYLDEEIKMGMAHQKSLREKQIEVYSNSNSSLIAGIQLADHAAHVLGGMLLEEIGILNKKVCPGDNSGYHPEETFNIGFEFWASLRYSLVGKQAYIESLSPHFYDHTNPYFLIDGYGLYIAPTCSDYLRKSAKECFGINYLGCIH